MDIVIDGDAIVAEQILNYPDDGPGPPAAVKYPSRFPWRICSVQYGAFPWARGALSGPKRRFLAAPGKHKSHRVGPNVSHWPKILTAHPY